MPCMYFADSDQSDDEEMRVEHKFIDKSSWHHLQPGTFQCERVWSTDFVLHSRLKSHRQGVSL